MAHTVKYFSIAKPPPNHTARCKCGWAPKPQATQQMVEDEVRKHELEVERVRLHLGTRTPSLKGQLDYYRQMADNPQVEPADRRLWKQLADELEPRVVTKGAPSGDIELPFP